MAFDRIKRKRELETNSEAWQQTAFVCWWMIQLLADKRSASKIKYEDLLPRKREPKKRVVMSAEQIKSLFSAFAAQHNAKIAAQNNAPEIENHGDHRST